MKESTRKSIRIFAYLILWGLETLQLGWKIGTGIAFFFFLFTVAQ